MTKDGEPKRCEVCGRVKRGRVFWTKKDGTKMDVCCDCIYATIDNKRPETFMWVLKELDAPFVEDVWVGICRKKYEEEPDNFQNAKVLGIYVRVMRNMIAYKDKTFADTEELNKDNIEFRKQHESAIADAKASAVEAMGNIGSMSESGYEIGGVAEIEEEIAKSESEAEAARDAAHAEVMDRLNAAEAQAKIAEAEAKRMEAEAKRKESERRIAETARKQEEAERKREEAERKREEAARKQEEKRMAEEEKRRKAEEDRKRKAEAEKKKGEAAEKKREAEMRKKEDEQSSSPGNGAVTAILGVDEQGILDGLSDDDVRQLSLKWGGSFTPSEWVKMEDMYRKYCGEFDISVDREAVLVSLCKTSMNMQRCLDAGDAQNAAKFSTMFDQLRKSGAFTDAQKKDDNNKYIDSIGELVGAVEREGGVIEKFDYSVEANPDKVDMTLKDMQSYTYNLIKNEMGLGDLIESYVQKLEQQMEEDRDREMKDRMALLGEDSEQALNDRKADEWLSNLEESVAASADEVYAKIDDDEDDYMDGMRDSVEGDE